MTDIAKETTQKVDFAHIVAWIWLKKYVLVIFLCIGVICGFVWYSSTPKEYVASMVMMPESMSKGGSQSQMAAMLGITMPTQTDDAYTPNIYPDIVRSIPFITGLFDVEIQTSASDTTYTLRQYMETKVREAWWYKIMGSLSSIGSISDGSATVATPDGEIIDPFKLTPKEMKVVSKLRSRLSAEIDPTTATVYIYVRMQDPLVAAQLTDTVAARLQEYITDYRTAKARNDLDYAITLNEEAQQQYYEAQQAYAEYMDRNQGLALYSAQTTRDRLDNEMKLAFNLYNQTSQRVQQCEAKIQESTPVFAIVNPATVPLYPNSPRKFVMLGIMITFWGGVGIIVILYPMVFGNRLKTVLRETREEKPLRRRWYHKFFRRRSDEAVADYDMTDDNIEEPQGGEDEDISRYAPPGDDEGEEYYYSDDNSEK